MVSLVPKRQHNINLCLRSLSVLAIPCFIVTMLKYTFTCCWTTLRRSGTILASIWTGTRSSPRILKPKEIVFDKRANNALKVLEEKYSSFLQHNSSTSSTLQYKQVLLSSHHPSSIHLQSSLNKSIDESDVENFIAEKDSGDTESCSSTVDEDEDHATLETSSTSSHSDQTEVLLPQESHELESNVCKPVRNSLQTLCTAGNTDRFTLTCTGYKGGHIENQINQDRSMIVQPLLENHEQAHETLLVGVLDGHGAQGHLCADFCQSELEKAITRRLQTLVSESTLNALAPQSIAQEIQQIVRLVDKRLPSRMGRDGGTTLSMVLQLGEWIYLINTGDSQSLLGAYLADTDESILLKITKRHVPSDPSEAERVKQAGAGISEDQAYVIYQHVEDEHGLAMTRSLGDSMAPGVIPTPEVSYYSKAHLIQQARQYLQVNGIKSTEPISLFTVSVSDGVLDVLSNDARGPLELPCAMGRALFDTHEVQHPMVATRNFIDMCAQRWYTESKGAYRDDIVIAASKIL